MPETLQLNLPGTCRADKKPRPPRRSEKVLDAQVVAVLGLCGYQTLQVGGPRRNGATGAVGNSVGCPDRLAFRDGWPPGIMLALELKGDGTRVRPAQQALADRGRIVLARTIPTVLEALQRIEQRLGETDQAERLDRFLAENRNRLH